MICVDCRLLERLIFFSQCLVDDVWDQDSAYLELLAKEVSRYFGQSRVIQSLMVCRARVCDRRLRSPKVPRMLMKIQMKIRMMKSMRNWDTLVHWTTLTLMSHSSKLLQVCRFPTLKNKK